MVVAKNIKGKAGPAKRRKVTKKNNKTNCKATKGEQPDVETAKDNKDKEGNAKYVSANSLKWSSVPISKGVDIVEGFFGLEEIEGVDVKYVDGQAHFVVKDKSKIRENGDTDVRDSRSKKNGSLLTAEEELELAEQDRERAKYIAEREEKDKKSKDKNKSKKQDQELIKEGDEEKEVSDFEEEFMGFSDAEDEAYPGQQPMTILSKEEGTDFEGIEDDEDQEDIDQELLADYKENLNANRLNSIIEDDDEINDAELPADFVNNWSDLSLSKYSLSSLSKLNFGVPTEIQKQCIPIAIGNHDLIGKASTGSGKTLAYGLPILERFLLRLKQNDSKPLSAPVGIIFTPTRELAKQVYAHLINVVSHYPLKNPKSLIVSITGGLSIQKQERLLGYNPGIIIATPGRLLEIIELNNNDILNKLSKIEMLTLDEADRLLQDGHFGEMENIIEVLNKVRNQNHYKKWQTLVFSATFSKSLFHKLSKNIDTKKSAQSSDKNKKTKSNKKSNSHRKHNSDMEILADDNEIISFLKSRLQFKDREPKLVNVNPKEIVSGTISEALIECDATNRDLYLYYFLIMYTGSTLIFTNSIDSVKRLNSFLKFLKIRAFSIHSSMMQKQRLKNLENFQKSCAVNFSGKSGSRKETVVLIATDVAARGLDIPNIDHVVHYHLPRSADLYIHRSGRTGRAGNEGVSIMLCSPQEAGGPLKRLRKLIIEEAMKAEKKKLQLQAAGKDDNDDDGNGSDKKKKQQQQLSKGLLSKFQTLNDDVKLLPMEVTILDQLRARSELASELAESDVSKSSLSKEDSWVAKVARDLDVDDLSDFEDESLRKNRNKKQNKTLDARKLQEKKRELTALLGERLRFGGGSKKYLSNGLMNMADAMLRGKGHDNIVGYNSVDVIEVIKRSQKHQDRLAKLQQQSEAQKEQVRERKVSKDKKKSDRRDKKRKRQDEIFGAGGGEGADDGSDGESDYGDEDGDEE